MLLLRLFLVLVFVAEFTVFVAQDIAGFSSQLIVLQENISNKSFVKSWKKTKKSWIVECKSAQSKKELISLSNSFIEVYNKSTSSSLFKIPDLEFGAVCNAFVNLIDQIPNENLSFSNSSLDEWKNDMQLLISNEQQRIHKEQQALELEKNKSRVLLVDSLIERFVGNYNSVFEGAHKGSFKEIITNNGLSKSFKVNLDFGSIANCSVFVDEDDVYELILVYSTNSDEKLANLIMESCYNHISSNLKEGFKESKMFDGNFQTNFIKVFDFQGEKFADTAKHPKIQIGIKKMSFDVYFKVTEPLFKR